MNLVYFVVSLILKMELDKEKFTYKWREVGLRDMGKFPTHNNGSSRARTQDRRRAMTRALLSATGDSKISSAKKKTRHETMLNSSTASKLFFHSFHSFYVLCSAQLHPLHERYNLIFVNKMKLDYCVDRGGGGEKGGESVSKHSIRTKLNFELLRELKNTNSKRRRRMKVDMTIFPFFFECAKWCDGVVKVVSEALSSLWLEWVEKSAISWMHIFHTRAWLQWRN